MTTPTDRKLDYDEDYSQVHEDDAYNAFEDDSDDFVAPVAVAPALAQVPVTAPANSFLPPLIRSRGLPDTPNGDATEYSHFITGSGAAKLAGSGVAPLVAAARGYARIHADNFAAEVKKVEMSLTAKQRMELQRSIAGGPHDGMLTPWYSVADLQSAHLKEVAVEPYTWQIRPQTPEYNDQGKPIKYEFNGATGTPLDVHPSTPIDWIDSTPVVLFGGDVLTSDSAMSAYLRSMGVSWGDLKYDGTFDPIARMRALLDVIPENDRVLFVSIASINNTDQRAADWRAIDLKCREGWIALDEGLDANWSANAEAQKLSKQLDTKFKMRQIRFLNPTVASGEEGSRAGVAIDGYLAKYGTWSMLLKQLTTTMPAAPMRNAAEKAGAFRVSTSGQTVEECLPILDGPGRTVRGYRWEQRVDLGGRILAMEVRRKPTAEEMRTGLFNPNVRVKETSDSQVHVEVSWSQDGNDFSAVVTGPQIILNYPPEDWVRHGAVVPSNLLLHHSWPPRAAKGKGWLAAVKGDNRHGMIQQTRWMRMGWVPVENDTPVYIVNDQVVGDSEFGSNAVAGIDKDALPVADSYGVGTGRLDGNFDDPEYTAQVAKDLREVMDAYITSGAWTDPSAAVIVLAAGLRPAVPLRPRSTVFFWGPKGGGKSWSAQCCMYFWARRKPDWQTSLPGSAKDTQAYIENALAHAPIWVIDDLAPSAVRSQAEAEDAKVADMTRAIFNNSTKGRMNKDMTSQTVNEPIAQLIITSENELTTPSAKERLVPVFVGKGKLHEDRNKTDRINDMARADGTQARLTSHLIRYIRHVTSEDRGGWAAYLGHLHTTRTKVKHSVATIMRELGASIGSLERTSNLAADLLLTLAVLQEMARELKMDDDFVEQFNVDGLGMEVVRLVTDAHAENQQAAPGASLIRALSSLLAAGEAHVIAGDDPTCPPVIGNEAGEGLTNDKLGWKAGGTTGSLRPMGPTIGTVLTSRGKQVILFDQMTAFAKAQAAFPTLIQYGQGTGSSWTSVWDEGLASEHVPRERNSKNGKYLNTVRIGPHASRVAGVPVDVEVVIRGGAEVDEIQLTEF